MNDVLRFSRRSITDRLQVCKHIPQLRVRGTDLQPLAADRLLCEDGHGQGHPVTTGADREDVLAASVTFSGAGVPPKEQVVTNRSFSGYGPASGSYFSPPIFVPNQSTI